MTSVSTNERVGSSLLLFRTTMSAAFSVFLFVLHPPPSRSEEAEDEEPDEVALEVRADTPTNDGSSDGRDESSAAAATATTASLASGRADRGDTAVVTFHVTSRRVPCWRYRVSFDPVSSFLLPDR